jgi:hypothetical protein
MSTSRQTVRNAATVGINPAADTFLAAAAINTVELPKTLQGNHNGASGFARLASMQAAQAQ